MKTLVRISCISVFMTVLTGCSALDLTPSFTDTFLENHTPQYRIQGNHIYKN